MILAELEVIHSRVYSPTRRLALGRHVLPTDPPPGFGPLLLGGLVATGADSLDDEALEGYIALLSQLEHGQRVVQPRLRHRYQADTHGLARTTCRLVGHGEGIDFDFDGHGTPLQMCLAAAYAAGKLPTAARSRTFDMLRKAMVWRGAIGMPLIAHLSGRLGTAAWTVAAYADPRRWALDVLGIEANGRAHGKGPGRREIQRRFRDRLREAHPDHGADTDGAAQRIADLTEARRILLG